MCVPGHEGITGNDTADHLARTGPEHLIRNFQKSGQGLDEQETYQTMGIHNRTQTGKLTNTRTLCQKIERSFDPQHRTIKMDSGTVYNTLPSKGTRFQNGVDG
jgi:hypothetical protein